MDERTHIFSAVYRIIDSHTFFRASQPQNRHVGCETNPYQLLWIGVTYRNHRYISNMAPVACALNIGNYRHIISPVKRERENFTLFITFQHIRENERSKYAFYENIFLQWISELNLLSIFKLLRTDYVLRRDKYMMREILKFYSAS